MTRSIICIVVIAAAGAVFFYACRKNTGKRYPGPTPLHFEVPIGFPQPQYRFNDNPLTEEGFALGKKLFYESQLSKFNDVSCGGCHQQHAAFTTFDHDLGHGTNNQHTTRNVPAIFNMAWHPSMQWDGRLASLEDQVLACLNASEKMGEEVSSVIAKLGTNAEYRDLTGRAFGDENLTGERMAKALAQFVGSIVSAGSKYDRIKKGQAAFNDSEQEGYRLFVAHCSSCHAEPMFSDFSFRNNGLGLNPLHTDLGRMSVTADPADSLKFKVPSLRNVTLTSYYAHDGRFSALSEMIDHYTSGIHQGPTLDPDLENGVALTHLEKFYLQEFLFTLADSAMISDPRFAR